MCCPCNCYHRLPFFHQFDYLLLVFHFYYYHQSTVRVYKRRHNKDSAVIQRNYSNFALHSKNYPNFCQMDRMFQFEIEQQIVTPLLCVFQSNHFFHSIYPVECMCLLNSCLVFHNKCCHITTNTKAFNSIWFELLKENACFF